MQDFPKISRMGERAILLQFEPEISEKVLEKVLAAQKIIQKKLLKEDVEVINTYNSLLVIYTKSIENAYDRFLRLERELELANIQDISKPYLFHLPVCYEQKFGLDLQEISEVKDLPKREIIRLHSSVIYTVYFTGFLPGFLYLGGLPESIHFSRREQPRIEVPKGAVGIGEKQTGIYPQKSPGGWNIIGNSPVPLFDPFLDPPCEIKSGDKIMFYEVSEVEHEEISKQVEKGEFKFRKEEYNG